MCTLKERQGAKQERIKKEGKRERSRNMDGSETMKRKKKRLNREIKRQIRTELWFVWFTGFNVSMLYVI